MLPFQNLSGDPEQEHFADGMVEEIITGLSRIRWFFVIARNSTFTYKGRAVDVKQVGRELGVRYVLEGSVRKSGDRIRMTAQLADAATGTHVWAERYYGDLADIFVVQDEIAERVVAAIEPELYAAEQVRSQSKPPNNLDAGECVIRALSCIGQGTRDENTRAEALCRRAIAIAPDYGRAHSLLAWALMRRSTWSGDLRSVVSEVSAETRTALALDDRDPWVHFAEGMLQLRLHHRDETANALRRALELNPNFALVHAFLAVALAHQGASQDAVDSAEHALAAEPARPASGHLCLARDGDGPFSLRALSGVRDLGAQRNREKSRIRSGALLSDRGSGNGGGYDRGGGGTWRAAPPPPGILTELDGRDPPTRRRDGRASARRFAQGRGPGGMKTTWRHRPPVPPRPGANHRRQPRHRTREQGRLSAPAKFRLKARQRCLWRPAIRPAPGSRSAGVSARKWTTELAINRRGGTC